MSAFAIIALITGYCGYFAGTWINYLSKTHKLCSKYGICTNLKELNYLHDAGIVLMGLPLVFINRQEAVFLPGVISVDAQRLLVLASLVLLTAYVGRKTAISAAQKLPGINNPGNARSLFIYLPVRIFFLAVYEFFFRGVLLGVSIYYFDVQWAIILNIALYTLLHFFSGKEELIFCPLFGAVLCILTIWFHSVLPAVILHITLSLSHEGYMLITINQQLKHHRS